jgi:hypothetical protein
MGDKFREAEGEEKWSQSIKPSTVIFFINDELVRLLHSNRAANICGLYNFNQDKEQSMLLTDFKKHRKRAYSISNTLKIFKRSRMQLERWIKKGIVPPPTGTVKGGARKFQKLSYYSEDDLFAIRDSLAKIHRGRPRKDLRTTAGKDVPSEKDLRSILGDAIMLYTKTEDGRFIPVWAEETW